MNINYDEIKDGFLGLNIENLKSKKKLNQLEKNNLLGWFAEVGDLEKVKELIENNADPMIYNCGCYRWSKQKGNTEVTEYLKKIILSKVSLDYFNSYVEK